MNTVPPGPDSAVPVQGQRVILSGGHLGELHSLRHSDNLWIAKIALVFAYRHLSEIVVSPSVHVAVAAQRQGVGQAWGYLGVAYMAAGGVDFDVGAALPGSFVGAGAPFAPFGGEGQVGGDGLVEVVGRVAYEPSVEGPSWSGGVVVWPCGGLAVGDGLSCRHALGVGL